VRNWPNVEISKALVDRARDVGVPRVRAVVVNSRLMDRTPRDRLLGSAEAAASAFAGPGQ